MNKNLILGIITFLSCMSTPPLLASAQDGLDPVPLYKPSSRSPAALDISLNTYGASSFAMGALNLGEVAPDFNLPQVGGGHYRLSDNTKPVVLIFYRGHW
ncbi:MAG: hypothetical protein ACI82A_002702 [Candidatus Azotimanducaceae bacterium]|jgi:hypothetical protein